MEPDLAVSHRSTSGVLWTGIRTAKPAGVDRDELKNAQEAGDEERQLVRGKDEQAEEAGHLREGDPDDEQG